MKKTQFIELLSTIKKTIVSFVSIAFFVLLGAAIFLGIDWSVTGYKNTVDKTLNDWNMHDISLTFPYGFSDEEIEKVKELDYVDVVEGQNSLEANFVFNNNRYQAKVILLTDKLDDAHKIIGKIPTKKGEIGFERHWAENNGIKVGDTIVFEHDDDGTAYSIHNLLNEDLDALQENKITEDGMLYLTTDTYKVTGLFENATYINQYKVTYGVSASTSIPNDCITYVSEESLDKKAFNGYRTLILTSPKLKGLNSFDDEYKEKNAQIVDRLQAYLEPYITKTNNSIFTAIENIRTDINKQIADGEKQIAKAEEDIIKGEKEIKDGEKQIADGKIKLADGEIELANAKDELDKGWVEYNAGLVEYNDGKKQVDDIDKLYDGLMKAIEVYKALENMPTYIKTYYDAYLSYASMAKELLDETGSEAKVAIKNLLNLYQAGTFDGDVNTLVFAIKNVINAEDLGSLKAELSNIESPDESITKLLELIDNLETINQQIDTALQFCDLFKIDFLTSALESEAIDFIDTEKEKINNFIDIIRNESDAVYTETQKYALIISVVLRTYDDNVDDVKSWLETNIRPKIDAGYEELAIAKVQLDTAYGQLAYGQKQYNDGLVEYKDGLAELEKNEKLLKQAKTDLADGKKKLAEGKEDLRIAKNKIKDFDDKVSEIERYDITLLGRSTNAGFASTVVPVDMMSSIKYTMVLLFIIVGIFVCYSALSRNVHDQIIQIGTKKALGLSRKEVTVSFLMYGTIATIIGCILGAAAARFIVEPIILNVLADNYILGENQYYFSLSSSILFLLFELVVTNLTTYLACNKILNKKAIKLLQGPEELVGKTHFYEKLPGWNSLPLLTKTIINNCVNDKRRMMSTLVGIAGCCSLMVSAMSLITNMNDSLDYQINNVAKFDTIVYVDTNVDNAANNISSKLDEMGLDHYLASYSSCAVENNNGDFVSGALLVYDDDEFFDFFDVTLDGKRQDIGEGICIANAYAQNNNVEVGDYVTILNGVGDKYNVKVGTIYDYYLLRVQTVINEDAFIKAFDYVPNKNAILIKRGDCSVAEINSNLYSVEGYISAFDYIDETIHIYRSLTEPMKIVIYTFFVLAVVLAFLVLLNLLIIFVDEKKKELIVMMINGYSRKRVKSYIYGDTIVLTIIGIIIGIVLGVTVGFATIDSFTSDCVIIMKNINIPSYLLCGALTALLSAITCIIALLKVKKFKLTDINSK